ncbi:MAG: response regulator [Deltaproteobacteria bacterium]|nr:response regulator [Deltaproteobacteria bacterium]
MTLSRRYSIRTKLVGGFLVVVVMSALIGGIAYNRFRSTETLVSDEVMGKAEARHLSGQIILKSNSVFVLVNDYLLAAKGSRREALRIIINDEIRTLREYMHQVSVQKLTPEEVNILTKLENLFVRYSNLIESILGRYREKEGTYNEIKEDVDRFRDVHFRFITLLQNFDSIETKNMYDSWDSARREISFTKTVILVFSGVVFMLGIFLGIVGTRMITVPVGKLLKTLEEYGSGNFDVRAKVLQHDEMGYLAERFNVMLDHINTYAEDLRRANADLTARNIELDQSQSQLQILTDTTPDAVLLIAPDGRVININQTCLEMFGYSREEIISLNVRQISDDEYSDGSIQEKIDRTFNDEDLDFEWFCKKKNGEEFPVVTRLRRMQIGDDVSILAIITDITEQKRVEDEKKHIEAQLLHAQKMEAIGTLAGGVAHDFNNVLQAISGYSQLLLMDKNTDDPEYKYLSRIDRSVQSAAELVKQLLIFSRKVESKLRPVNLNLEIAQIEKILERTIPRMISIETRLDGNLALVNADPIELEQILMNLAVNAGDAMPDGGKFVIETGNITLDENYCRTHVGAKPGDYVLLTVSDTGHGMDRKTQQHIFEPFFTTKDVGKGTGLGLSIVYGIVKGHSGYIMCYSEPGRGSTFEIHFPVLTTEDDGHVTVHNKETEEMVVVDGLHGNRETVLLVDDEENILEIGRDVLEQFGYMTLTAESGEKALEIYEREGDRIDVVILDLGMPGMGGHKCLKRLLEINPEVKVIVASGYSDNGSVKETLDAGAVGFIGKPYKLSDMLDNIKEVLKNK